MKWFRLAAAQGIALAQFKLGFMYKAGEGVPQDYVQAHKWFNLAASRGNPSALARRIEISQEMSSEQIAEAQKLAREWLKNPALKDATQENTQH